jgi:hypothetical protein
VGEQSNAVHVVVDAMTFLGGVVRRFRARMIGCVCVGEWASGAAKGPAWCGASE